MAVTLDTDLLRKKLGRARLSKENPSDNRKDPLPELSKGLKYLIENVLDPMSYGDPVHSGNLDFTKFDDFDLADLYDYYMEHCYDGSKDWYRLKAVYTTCRSAASQTAPISFL